MSTNEQPPDNVIDIATKTPHVVINCVMYGGHEVHTYPLSYFQDLVSGKSVEPLPTPVLRAIIADAFGLDP